MGSASSRAVSVEESVHVRYTAGAKNVEPGLCCPTSYDPTLLAAIPQEVLDRDYGCGDPTVYLKPGEIVLDLGAGAGKICFLASQVVGPSGRVIGIDMNREMLAVGRKNVPEVVRRIGYGNVEFRMGKIQDLKLDLEAMDKWLTDHPVNSAADLIELDRVAAQFREAQPLVSDESIDVVVSNCVLNLVRSEDKEELFREIFRVLRRGGRAVISDIVSDEDVPAHMQADPELWSGCISGACREDLFLRAFEDAGFYGISILSRQAEPWRTVEGIEFRSMTLVAYKGKQGQCLDQKHAVIYRGPFRLVEDDDGHTFHRGVRTAVCEKSFRILSKEPYHTHIELVPPRVLVPLDEAPPFPCTGGVVWRNPRETKGADYKITTDASRRTCPPKNGSNGSCC